MRQTKEEKTTSSWMKEAQKGYIRVAALILINRKPAHGYEIMKEIREKTKGFWTPTAGGMYPILSNLEKSGYIKGTWETEKNRKLKTYAITDRGRQILERAIIKQDEIANSMNALFKDFARDVLNIETNSHPLMPSFFSAFLEEDDSHAESLQDKRRHTIEVIKLLRERLDLMQERLKRIDSSVKEMKHERRDN